MLAPGPQRKVIKAIQTEGEEGSSPRSTQPAGDSLSSYAENLGQVIPTGGALPGGQAGPELGRGCVSLPEEGEGEGTKGSLTLARVAPWGQVTVSLSTMHSSYSAITSETWFPVPQEAHLICPGLLRGSPHSIPFPRPTSINTVGSVGGANESWGSYTPSCAPDISPK